MPSWRICLFATAFCIVSSNAYPANTARIFEPSRISFDSQAINEKGNPCRVEGDDWTLHTRAGANDPLGVHSWFKGGSGRYWSIAINNGGNGWICLSTSTLGWRTLQKFDDGPLPWTRDFDGDGLNEFIYWQSSALGQSISSGYGLAARVYRIRGRSELVLDSIATLIIRRHLIMAYQRSMDQLPEWSRQQRKNAAELIRGSLSEI
ncbi:MAG: hypothetical protein GKR90_10630 [Pseudomonadales bacterium]|nr:hypothetical protein [Pseudomonadales bacterium]